MTIRNGFLIFTAAACIWPAQGQEQPKQEQPKQEQPKEVVGKPGAKEIFLSRQIPYIDPDEKPAPAKPEKSTAGTKVKPKPKLSPGNRRRRALRRSFSQATPASRWDCVTPCKKYIAIKPPTNRGIPNSMR